MQTKLFCISAKALVYEIYIVAIENKKTTNFIIKFAVKVCLLFMKCLCFLTKCKKVCFNYLIVIIDFSAICFVAKRKYGIKSVFLRSLVASYSIVTTGIPVNSSTF